MLTVSWLEISSVFETTPGIGQAIDRSRRQPRTGFSCV
jgi:hypothetical protein